MKTCFCFALSVLAAVLGAADLFKESKEPLILRLGQKTPEVDGVFGKDEYPLSGIGFRGMRTKNFSPLPTEWGVSYDSKYLYVVVSSPCRSDMPAKHTRRDGNIWEDESVEIHLQPQADGRPDFHFIINPAGGIYDAKNRKSAWNISGLQLKNVQKNGKWTLEAAIPFAGLGVSDPRPGNVWKINLCRSYKSNGTSTSLAPCFFQYAEPGYFPLLVFGDARTPHLKLPDFRQLTRGNLAMTAVLRSPRAGETAFECNITPGVKAGVSGENNKDKRILLQCRKSVVGKEGESVRAALPDKPFPPVGTFNFTITAPGNLPMATGKLTYKPLVPLSIANLFMDFSSKELVSVCSAECDMSGAKVVLDFHKLGNDCRTAEEKSSLQKHFTVNTSAMKFELRTKIDDLAPGHYKINYSVFYRDGKSSGSSWYEWFFKPGSQNPFDTKEIRELVRNFIPRPWTAPVSEKNTFGCLLRKYTLGKTGLLDAAVSRDKDLLRRPAELLLNGKKLPAFKGGMTKKDKIGADYLLETQADGIGLKAKVRAEYDGLLQYELELIPLKKDVTLSSLSLKLPLIAFPKHGFFDSQELFGAKDRLPFAPGFSRNVNLGKVSSCWIGDMERGLIFGAPSLKNWHVKNLEKSAVLTSPGSGNDIDILFWDTPGKLEKPRKLRFFLMATPVRTLTADSLKIRPWVNAITWTGYWVQMYEYHRSGWLNPKKVREFEKHKKMSRFFHYTSSYGVSPHCGEWRFYQQLWHTGTLGHYTVDSRTPDRASYVQSAYTEGCLNCRSFSDFKLSMLKDMLNRPELRIRNLYLDLSSPLICRNPHHGCAYTDDFGRLCGSSQVLGCREHVRALAVLLQQKNPKGMLEMHVFTRTPADAYVDLVIMGELFDRIIARERNYYKLFTPDLMMGMFSARNPEQMVFASPQFLRSLQLYAPALAAKWNAKDPKISHAIRHFMTTLMLNRLNSDRTRDMEYHLSTWCYPAEDFTGDIAQAAFYPYWNNAANPIRITGSDTVLMSTYRGTNGKTLAVVVNQSPKRQKAAIDLGKTPVRKLTNFYFPEQKLQLSGNRINLTMAPYDSLLIGIE